MSMSKKDFIALADYIRDHNKYGTVGRGEGNTPFTETQIAVLSDFCQRTNSNFMRDRWLDYIAGKCGKNGGKVKVQS